MTTTGDRAVYVHTCSGCGLEAYGFQPQPRGTVCVRCGGGFRPVRRIDRPHPDTVRRAERGDMI